MKHTKKFMVVPFREDYLTTTTKKLVNPDLNANLPIVVPTFGINSNTESNKTNESENDFHYRSNELEKVQNTLNIILSRMRKESISDNREKYDNKLDYSNRNQISFDHLKSNFPSLLPAKTPKKKPVKRKVANDTVNESYNFPIAKQTRNNTTKRKEEKTKLSDEIKKIESENTNKLARQSKVDAYRNFENVNPTILVKHDELPIPQDEWQTNADLSVINPQDSYMAMDLNIVDSDFDD